MTDGGGTNLRTGGDIPMVVAEIIRAPADLASGISAAVLVINQRTSLGFTHNSGRKRSNRRFTLLTRRIDR